MSLQIKSIDTFYKGYTFRSRLEARWAVFFDVLNIKWEYEIEGFTLSDGRKYLPDFKVRTLGRYNSWYEIKPLGDLGDGKFEQFKNDMLELDDRDTGDHFMILSGDPRSVIDSGYNICPRCGNIIKEKFFYCSNNEYYIDCGTCDIDTPFGMDLVCEEGLTAPTLAHEGMLCIEVGNYAYHNHLVDEACNESRSARFEHNSLA
jgi:hypothetical protein